MKLILESDQLEDFLSEVPPIITISSPQVLDRIKRIESRAKSRKEKAEMAFKIARDEVHHTFDTKNRLVTITAEDALERGEGICFAKSHVLAALLRGMGIPAGFCYQRVLRKDTLDSGYALHGLNAVYLEESGWFRLDPRGNKPGIDSQFSVDVEKLAYPIREELGEIDYPNVFAQPLPSVIMAMENSKDSSELFFKRPKAL